LQKVCLAENCSSRHLLFASVFNERNDILLAVTIKLSAVDSAETSSIPVGRCELGLTPRYAHVGGRKLMERLHERLPPRRSHYYHARSIGCACRAHARARAKVIVPSGIGIGFGTRMIETERAASPSHARVRVDPRRSRERNWRAKLSVKRAVGRVSRPACYAWQRRLISIATTMIDHGCRTAR